MRLASDISMGDFHAPILKSGSSRSVQFIQEAFDPFLVSRIQKLSSLVKFVLNKRKVEVRKRYAQTALSPLLSVSFSRL